MVFVSRAASRIVTTNIHFVTALRLGGRLLETDLRCFMKHDISLSDSFSESVSIADIGLRARVIKLQFRMDKALGLSRQGPGFEP